MTPILMHCGGGWVEMFKCQLLPKACSNFLKVIVVRVFLRYVHPVARQIFFGTGSLSWNLVILYFDAKTFSFLSSSSRTKLQLFEVDENGDDGDDDFPHRYLPKLNAK